MLPSVTRMRRHRSVLGAAPGRDRQGVLLGGVTALFVAAFVWLTWLTHARLGTFGFDLGIFDQGVWLLSRYQTPCHHPRIAPYRSDRPPSQPRPPARAPRRRSRRAPSITRATSSATPRPNRKAYSGRCSNVLPPR